MVHRQSVYIVLDENKKLALIQYAPTMDYSGKRDSDQYSTMMGLFFDEPTHELWLQEVPCYRNQHSTGGVDTIVGLTCTIIAKQSFDWDMSKPLGERKSNVKETADFSRLLLEYKNQSK